MLRSTIWLLRTAAVFAIGIAALTDTERRGPVADAAVAVAFALSGVAMAVWLWLEIRGELESARRVLLPVILTVAAVSSAAVCTQPGSAGLLGITLITLIGISSEAATTVGVCAAAAAIVTVEIGARFADTSPGTRLGYPLILLVGVLAGLQRHAYRVRAEQSTLMLRRAEELRAEQRRVAVLDERTRIAREIHDVLAHSLGALGIQIQTARALVEDGCDSGRVDEVLAVAQRMAAEGLTETRRAVHALRADTAPLDQQLAAMARTHRLVHDCAVAVHVTGTVDPLPSDHTLALARVAQESLTNAAKHAPHQHIEVTLGYEQDTVTLTVTNSLEPGSRAQVLESTTGTGGYGLTGMRERLLLLGGSLEAGVADGRWAVVAEVPR